jgi:hypothetical protein
MNWIGLVTAIISLALIASMDYPEVKTTIVIFFMAIYVVSFIQKDK